MRKKKALLILLIVGNILLWGVINEYFHVAINWMIGCLYGDRYGGCNLLIGIHEKLFEEAVYLLFAFLVINIITGIYFSWKEN